MPTAAFHQRQQEDESERLSLYIHAQHLPRLLFRREKEPSTAPDFQRIIPSFCAAPRSRACSSLSLPSECQVFSQRWLALLDAHCPPRGRSHQRQPVTKMNSSEFKTLRGCAAGIPRLFFALSGKISSTSSHSASLIPSNLPGMSAALLEKGSLTYSDISGIGSCGHSQRRLLELCLTSLLNTSRPHRPASRLRPPAPCQRRSW